MNSQDDVENLEKLMGQLRGFHQEMSLLSKKAPSDGVNDFKLSLINRVIELGNDVLGEKYRPFSEFDAFNRDDVPSTSDVTLILSQYLEEAERFRSDNVERDTGSWFYVIDKEVSDIRSAPPSEIGKK